MRDMYRKYAHLLVHYSLGLNKGDTLLIVSTYLSEPLVQEVYREALAMGAHPETWIMLNGITRRLYDEGSTEQLEHVSPLFAYAVEHYDAFLTVRAPFHTRELETVDPEKKKMVSISEAALPGAGGSRGAAVELVRIPHGRPGPGVRACLAGVRGIHRGGVLPRR
jgi:aminopeptidase